MNININEIEIDKKEEIKQNNKESKDQNKYVRTKRSVSILPLPKTSIIKEEKKIEDYERLYWGCQTSDMCIELFDALVDVWMYYNYKIQECIKNSFSQILKSNQITDIFEEFSDVYLQEVKNRIDKSEQFVKKIFEVRGDKIETYKKLIKKTLPEKEEQKSRSSFTEFSNNSNTNMYTTDKEEIISLTKEHDILLNQKAKLLFEIELENQINVVNKENIKEIKEITEKFNEMEKNSNSNSNLMKYSNNISKQLELSKLLENF